jgi:hypothetical protein
VEEGIMTLPISKTFGEGDDQVIFVRYKNDEDDPTINIYFIPKVEGLDTARTRLAYNDEDARDDNFELLTEDYAIKTRDHLRGEIAKMFAGRDEDR